MLQELPNVLFIKLKILHLFYWWAIFCHWNTWRIKQATYHHCCLSHCLDRARFESRWRQKRWNIFYPIKAESFVFKRQTLPIFHGSLARPILMKISGIVYLYTAYLSLKNQISTSKTKNLVWSAMFIFFRKIFDSETQLK